MKNTHLKRLLWVLVLIFSLSVLATACAQVEIVSEFEPDGSAMHSITATVDRTLLDTNILGGEVDEILDFDAIERQAESMGFSSERIDTSERLGIMVSRHVEDNSDLGEALNELFPPAIQAILPVGRFEGSFTEAGNLGSNEYQFEMTIDSGDSLEGLLDEIEDDRVGLSEPSTEDQPETSIGSEFDMDLDVTSVEQFLNLTYTAGMPGEITDHNGADLGGGRVQWDIPLQGQQTFFAESQEGTTFSIALIVGIALGVLTLVLLIAGGVILMRGKRMPDLNEQSGGA
jgi:hypothetical protein